MEVKIAMVFILTMIPLHLILPTFLTSSHNFTLKQRNITKKKVFLWQTNAHRTVEIPMQFLLSFNPTLLLYSRFYPAVYNNTSLFRILQGEKWFIVLHSSSTRLTLSGSTNKYGEE